MFWNPYWYKTATKPLQGDVYSYYRWIPTYSDVLKATTNYKFRLKSEERFDTRINVLKYNSWFVVNLYWFQSDKTSQRYRKVTKLRRHTLSTHPITKSSSQVAKLNKIVSPRMSSYNF